MASENRISVVMITHNRQREVTRSLEMFHRETVMPPLIVVDNASTDQTRDVIASQFPSVKLICLPTNSGTVARNVGVEFAQTPYVALADDDTYWEPGSVARAADLFDAHSKLAVVVGKVLTGELNELDPICLELENSPLRREPGMPGAPLIGFLAGASAVRRSAFLEAGGFPTWSFLGGEEELLALDFAKAGWWMCYVPDIVVHHFPSAIRDRRLREVNLIRNRVWSAWMRRSIGVATLITLEIGLKSLINRQAREALLDFEGNRCSMRQNSRQAPDGLQQRLALLERQKAILAAK
jgi:GT2 family glycosyltransferase